MTPFDRLNSKVQKAIYRMGWERFRPIQDEAILLLTEAAPNDLVIAAPTASGKTEAAFLPILSKVLDDPQPSVRVLYVSPLKALINDQFRRVELLCRDTGVAVTRWHGDAPEAQKRALLKNPQGILLITPESLEALLLNRAPQLRAVFAHLAFVVIDEVHTFIGQERGAQLRSLLSRLDALIARTPVRIALSATLGDPTKACEWISSRPSRPAALLQDTDSSHRAVEGMIQAYDVPGEDARFEDDLARHFAQGKCLIFANSKSTLELWCDRMITRSKRDKMPSRYRVHHGSLSKELREATEETLKNGKEVSVFCTNTLELGIDIGDIDRIGLLDPPWSVASFIQRIGRSGRRQGEIVRFQFLIGSEPIQPDTPAGQKLRVRLFQSIATIRLFLDQWCEPLRTDHPHLSTYVHQLLAFIQQKGGADPGSVFEQVNARSFRGLLSEAEFVRLLRHLKEHAFIAQAENGDLLLGKSGERLASGYEFYGVFQSPEEWAVVEGGRPVGTLPLVIQFQPSDQFILAGTRWQVRSVSTEARTLIVEVAKVAKPPIFNDSFGVTHPRIHQEMLRLYTEGPPITFLDEKAQTHYSQGLEQFKLMVGAGDGLVLPTFIGTRAHMTLVQILRLAGVEFEDLRVGLASKYGSRRLLEILNAEMFEYSDAGTLAAALPASIKRLQKFDSLLTEELLNRSYGATLLDLEGAKEFLKVLRLRQAA